MRLEHARQARGLARVVRPLKNRPKVQTPWAAAGPYGDDDGGNDKTRERW